MPLPGTVEAIMAQVGNPARRVLSRVLGGSLGLDGRRAVHERLQGALRDMGIEIPADQMDAASEQVLRELQRRPLSPPRSQSMNENFGLIYGRRAGMSRGVAEATVMALERRPLDYRSEAEARMAQEIMAAEDQRIFDTLDQIAREGTFADPRVLDVSLVTHPTDPLTRIRTERRDVESIRDATGRIVELRVGEVYETFEPEYIGRFPVRQELSILPADPPRAPIGLRVYEEPGEVVVNPRAVERLQARRVTFPGFEISSNPQISLQEVQARRFDLIERDRFAPPAVLRAEFVWFSFMTSREERPAEMPENRPDF